MRELKWGLVLQRKMINFIQMNHFIRTDLMFKSILFYNKNNDNDGNDDEDYNDDDDDNDNNNDNNKDDNI